MSTAPRTVLLVPPVSDTMLAASLRPPSAIVLELDAGSVLDAEDLAPWGETAAPGSNELPARPPSGPASLFLRLTTASAYNLPVATCLVERLRQRPSTPEPLLERLELVLQEAIANAIMHGNLGIPRLARPDRDAMDAMMERLGQRLADPRFASRPLTIRVTWTRGAITLTVQDVGDGFAPPPAPAPDPDALAASAHPAGRGIGLMRALADRVDFSHGGRAVALQFAVTAPANPAR